MSRSASHSLRTRLLGFLLGAVLLAALVQVGAAYGTALNEADHIFDRHMQKMAESLRSGMPLHNVVANHQTHPDRADEDFVVQVWTPDGTPVFESAAHRALRWPSPLGFSSVQTLDHRTFRVFSLHAPTEIVQIAQDMAARRDMAEALAWRTAWPSILTAPLLMLVVWWVVSGSLAPVARVRAQMAARRVVDPQPLSEAGLPDELLPLIREFNLLFDRVRQAFAAQQSFVADAAHELRSPLAALRIQLQGLLRAPDDATRDKAIRRLSAGIDRASHLVDQLLMLARHEADAATEPAPESVDLAQVGLLALTDSLLAAQARQIDLGAHRTEAAFVQGHAEALRVLVRNLLDNAIKYTTAEGTVDLEVAREGGQVVLSVEDTGPGIPPAERERAMDRFYRLSGSPAEGSGLGLAIVRAIAQRHGASVQLDTSARLGGLRVRVTFAAAG
jgi:two-component system OmpR family sensor kinase